MHSQDNADVDTFGTRCGWRATRRSRNPVVNSPLIGATKPHHLADAVAALDIALTDDEVAALEAVCVPRTPAYLN